MEKHPKIPKPYPKKGDLLYRDGWYLAKSLVAGRHYFLVVKVDPKTHFDPKTGLPYLKLQALDITNKCLATVFWDSVGEWHHAGT